MASPLEFEPGSSLALSGGDYLSGHSTNFGGDVIVNAGGGSTMHVSGTVTFENGSTTMLTGNLSLENGATVVQVGAGFGGAGRLVNEFEFALAPAASSTIDVLVENQGTHAVAGAAIGRNDFADYIQTATGDLEFGLNGTGVGQFDRMFVDGQVQLAGALELSLGGGYVPASMICSRSFRRRRA